MKTTSENDKPHFPTATALEHRLGFFQPTRRPKHKKQTVETPWGIIKIDGRLGQQHADVFESICFEREKKAELEDGRIKLLVDPARVRHRARIVSGEQFSSICNELQTALLQILEPTEKACSGHLIDHLDFAMRHDGSGITRRNPLGGERGLWRVELGKAFCKLVEKDIWVGHDPGRVAALESGIAQAIARHLLTHATTPNGGWKIDGLIRAVAGDLSDENVRHRRREIRLDAPGLAALGFIVADDRMLKA